MIHINYFNRNFYALIEQIFYKKKKYFNVISEVTSTTRCDRQLTTLRCKKYQNL